MNKILGTISYILDINKLTKVKSLFGLAKLQRETSNYVSGLYYDDDVMFEVVITFLKVRKKKSPYFEFTAAND